MELTALVQVRDESGRWKAKPDKVYLLLVWLPH